MNKKLLSSLIFSALTLSASANHADSVYVKAYRAGNALRISYSVDRNYWTPLSNSFNLLQSDYGPWGSEKKMASEPSMLRDSDGQWYVVFALNDRTNQFATSHTRDLSCWVPQDYPYMSTNDENVINPILTKRGNIFVVTYSTSKGNTYETTSPDFKHWSPAAPCSVSCSSAAGLTRAPWQEISSLITRAEASAFRASRDNTGMGSDDRTFEKLKDVHATLHADLSHSKSISPDLLGIFFEDINYAADGGLYAELLQNRDFEYNHERKEWDAKTAWKSINGDISWSVETADPIHANNAHYSVLDVKTVGEGIANEGWDGIPVKKGEKYDFSVFLKSLSGKSAKVKIQLRDGDKVIAEQSLSAKNGSWSQQKTVLSPTASCDNATLAIVPQSTGKIAIDFASLFPQKTFKNRKNGLRADLAQTLADMHPRFVRFPGGCASHGQGIDNIYHWQATVGKLWERQPDFNIWNYHQSRGLGFFEYFLFCEDIGAQPLPVLAAGVPCQNSWKGGNGQQGGLPWEADLQAIAAKQGKTIDEVAPYHYMGKPLTMESYLQELLDLIEWANGDAKTSKLAKMRAEAGHPKPFNMKYLGIGNEDLISEVFIDRYTWLIKKVREAHPEITVVGTVGPFWEDSDYETGWDLARRENISIVDEHYYNPIGWYLNHQDFYDKYDRNGTKVYLGEWASKGNRWENALAEAIHITNLERNADVVVMSSYAPLLARHGHTQWNPDLIYFDNKGVYPTPNYYLQMLAGQNNGSEYIFSDLSVTPAEGGSATVSQRVKASIVKAENGDIIVKLVNALPKESTLTTDLGDLSGFTSVTIQQISSPRDAREVNGAEKKTITLDEVKNLTLPAYSFSVIRITKQ